MAALTFNATDNAVPRDSVSQLLEDGASGGATTATATDLAASPGLVQVTYAGGVALATLTISLVGYGTLTTTTLDEAGSASLSVLIPSGTSAGSHTLNFVSSSTTTSATFQVLSVQPTPTPPPAGTPPTPVVTTRWVLQDVGPGGITYTFPNNPSRMSSPHPQRIITAERSTSPTGQALLWEGAARPYSWEFAGYCGTEDFFNNLKAFVEINRRFYLTDHRSRQWIVTFDYFDAVPRNDINNYWAHDYTMRATIYGGPL